MIIASIVIVILITVAVFTSCEMRAYHGAVLMRWSNERRLRQLESTRIKSARLREEKEWLARHNQRMRIEWRIRLVVNAVVVLFLLVLGTALIIVQLSGVKTI